MKAFLKKQFSYITNAIMFILGGWLIAGLGTAWIYDLVAPALDKYSKAQITELYETPFMSLFKSGIKIFIVSSILYYFIIRKYHQRSLGKEIIYISGLYCLCWLIYLLI